MPERLKAYRLRCYPTREQRQRLARHFGAARFVWNIALRARSEAYRDPELVALFGRGLSVTSVDLSRWLTRLKRDPEFAWLAEIDSSVITQVLRDQDQAFAHFFAGRARYPKPRKRQSSAAVRFAFDQRHVGKLQAWAAGDLVLPQLGRIDVRWSARPGAVPKLVTVSIDAAGRFHVSMAVTEDLPALPVTTGAVGIDVGVKDLVVTSAGAKLPNPKKLRGRLRHLKRLQRQLARKTKGSGRYRRQRSRIGVLHAKISDARRDALHQASRHLVDQHQILCIEDLNVKGMAQNRRLAQAVSDAGISELHRQLAYKAEWAGRSLVKIDRWFPSSKRCCTCGQINESLTLADRQWTCQACRIQHDRDVNAAANILAEGLRIHAGIGVGPGGANLMRVEGVRPSSPAPSRRRRRAPDETRTGQPTPAPTAPAAIPGVATSRISAGGG